MSALCQSQESVYVVTKLKVPVYDLLNNVIFFIVSYFSYKFMYLHYKNNIKDPSEFLKKVTYPATPGSSQTHCHPYSRPTSGNIIKFVLQKKNLV